MIKVSVNQTSGDSKGSTKGTHKLFSLMEMLIVVAVIAILASILLPQFSNAKEVAFRAECANNLANIGQTFNYYFSENNGKMPRYDWMLEAGIRDAYRCPKDEAPKVMDFYNNDGEVMNDVDYSYGFNLSSGDTNILRINNPSEYTTSFDAGDLYGYYVKVNIKSNSGHGNNEDGNDTDNKGAKTTNYGEEDTTELKAPSDSSYGSVKWATDIGGVAPTDTDNWYYQNLTFRHLDTACHLFLDGSVRIEHNPLGLESLLVDISTNTSSVK